MSTTGWLVVVAVLLILMSMLIFLPTTPKDQEVVVASKRRQSLRASVTLACSSCRAPGLFSSDERIRIGWPACYDPQRAGQNVGRKCPNCGTERPDDIDKGEIWHRDL